jgi:hypothetical protein
MAFGHRFWGIGTDEGILAKAQSFKYEAEKNRCKELKILNSLFQEIAVDLYKGLDNKTPPDHAKRLIVNFLEVLMKYY